MTVPTPPDPWELLAELEPNRRFMKRSYRDILHEPSSIEINFGIDPADLAGASAMIGDPVPSPVAAMPIAMNVGDYYEAIIVHEFEAPLDLTTDRRRGTIRNLADEKIDEAIEEGWLTEADRPSVSHVRDRTEAPAPINYIPTSTSNINRPRTVAAGYDPQRLVLTLVFRDGTFYNYYLESLGKAAANRLWGSFKSSRSKGKFMLDHGFDYFPRGRANVSKMPVSHREALYKIARTGQITRKGVTGRQKAGTKKYAAGETYKWRGVGGK